PPESSSVTGRLRPGEEEQPILALDPAAYDPAALARPYAELARNPTSSTLTGVSRASDGLEVADDLRLEGALVYVQGDATVSGSLTGDGILAVSGDLTLGNHAAMGADHKVALLSGGKLTVRGQGRAGSLLRGMVYAEGGLEASRVTIQGVVVCPGEESVSFAECALLYDADAGRVEVTPGGTRPEAETGFNVLADGTLSDDPPASGAYLAFEFMRVGDGMYSGNFSIFSETHEAVGGMAWWQFESLDELVAAVAEGVDGNLSAAVDREQVKARLVRMFEDKPGDPQDGGQPVQVDPSRLLPLKDRYRVLLWRES
ncbi:MAG: hypothetical protein AB1758_26905, partial [Candidatus Eremiobacterota bacterium]